MSGCATITEEQATKDGGTKPSNENSISFVKNYINTTFKDPSSAQQLKIYEPSPGVVVVGSGFSTRGKNGWIICFEVNAKNSYGGYGGVKLHTMTVLNNSPRSSGHTQSEFNIWCKADSKVIYPKE